MARKPTKKSIAELKKDLEEMRDLGVDKKLIEKVEKVIAQQEKQQKDKEKNKKETEKRYQQL